MAASLSEEEFQRMQTQLLELRTKNYSLEEKNFKTRNELVQNHHLLEDFKKELVKAQKIISRSKNAKDVDQLVQENETLQRKLQSQEDEFRLQNETLMHELSSLVSSNEELTKELVLVKAEQLSASELETRKDRIRLEAENTALRKLLSSITPHGQDNAEEVKNEGGSQWLSETIDTDFKLKFETESEEKKILQNRLRELEGECREQMLKMQNENEKLAEKLRKKQESFLRLQEEKEQLYTENKKSLESLQASKETESKQLKIQFQSVQAQLKNLLELNEKITMDDVETDGKSEATVAFIDGEKASFDCALNETKLSLIHFQEKMHSVNKQLLTSESRVQTLEEAKNALQLKVQELESRKNELQNLLMEKSKLAETRKNLMDEMNNHLLETTNKHSREIENLTRQLSNEQEALQKLFDKEKETELKLIDSRNEVQTLKDEIERLKIARCGADDKLKKVENNLEKIAAECENKLKQNAEEHAVSVESFKNEFQCKIQDLMVQVEIERAEKAEFEEKVNEMEQEVKDLLDDRKIQEKKGLAMVKDLKRQLQVERNRAEKLQERLQDVLNEQNRTVDEILQSPSTFDKAKGDASSISSWSYVSGGTADRENREGNLQSDNSSGGHDSPNRVSPTMLETETNNLLAKIAQLQQKNWTLEEKVNHLEMSNEALVDDVLKKTALIQYYCMEGRSDPHASVAQDKLTIKRIVDFIKDKGDENLREINRRMQRMLEETLTKNMHLQKDIETLSNEVSRLSKIVSPPAESAVFIERV